MSMNLKLVGSRSVVVSKTGEEVLQTVNVKLNQTPTKVTYEIYGLGDFQSMLASYFEWVMSGSSDEVEPVYADDDLFSEREPIKYITVNYGKLHVEGIIKELTEYMNSGYEFKFEVI